jgi:hypothetical protein
MSSSYFKEIGNIELNFGSCHLDTLSLDDDNIHMEFWNDEIDGLILAIKEMETERKRIKSIQETN